jgi:hypothetical protein
LKNISLGYRAVAWSAKQVSPAEAKKLLKKLRAELLRMK